MGWADSSRRGAITVSKNMIAISESLTY